MPVTVRAIAADELSQFTRVNLAGFGERVDPWHRWWFETRVVPRRTAAAFDAAHMVGSSAWFPVQLAVPGTIGEAGAISAVTVLPTHRRQGILREMMSSLLAGMRAEGVAIAALQASEGGIYSRFGFGPAARSVEIAVERPRNELIGSGWVGRRTLLTPTEALEVLPAVHGRLLATRPGGVARDDETWSHMLSADDPHLGRGEGPLQILVHQTASAADGYALYRVSGTHGHGLRQGTLRIAEMVATTPEASRELWRHCLEVDLVDRVEARGFAARPLDDPLFWLAQDPQAIEAKLIWTVWILLLDVPAALEQRGYLTDGSLVIQLRRPTGAEDRIHLRVVAGKAQCTPTSNSPDLSLSLSDLSSAYLGNPSLAAKARAGIVTELTPGAARAADELLAWDPPPWSFEDL